MSFIKSTSIITNIAVTVPNLTGGTNGKVVRVSGSNTVSDASSADTAVQLNALLIKQDGVYYGLGVVPGFTSLSAGAPYFLAADGTITSSPPVPTSTTTVVCLGFAINTTDLFFRPSMPITGV